MNVRTMSPPQMPYTLLLPSVQVPRLVQGKKWVSALDYPPNSTGKNPRVRLHNKRRFYSQMKCLPGPWVCMTLDTRHLCH